MQELIYLYLWNPMCIVGHLLLKMDELNLKYLENILSNVFPYEKQLASQYGVSFINCVRKSIVRIEQRGFKDIKMVKALL